MYTAPLPPAATQRLCRLLFFCIVGISAALLCFLLLHLDRGLECSDEGTYFIHIATPFAPLAKTTDYGSLLHPFYMWLGESFYALRVGGFLLLAATAAALGGCLLRLCRRSALPWYTAGTLPAVLACSVVAYYSQWTPTPSYNMLALEGILASLCCLLLYTDNETDRRPQRPLRLLLLLGLAAAGVLTFIGKGTTGAGLAIVALLWLFLSPRRSSRATASVMVDALLAGGLALLLLGLYLHFVSEGFSVTLQKILNGVSSSDESHGLMATLPRYLSLLAPGDYLPTLLGYPLWLAVIVALEHRRTHLAVALAVCIAGLYILLGLCINSAKVQGLCVFPFAVMMGYAAWFFRDTARPARQGEGSRFCRGLGGALLACAFVYHTGTNVDVALKLTEGFVLMAAGILTLLLGTRPDLRPLLIGMAGLVLCCMSGAALSRTLLDTYRHGVPMSALTEPVELTPGTRPLLTHPARRDWIRWLRRTAADNGWRPGTPLLFTSAQVTAASRLLNAALPAVSWPGEQRYTSRLEQYIRVFRLANPEILRKAWILKPAQDGPRHMPAAVLPLLGLPFPHGYDLVGISPAEGVWPPEVYELWRPRSE